MYHLVFLARFENNEYHELFSDKKLIAKYLPENKKHMVNIAENASKRIALDVVELEEELVEEL